MPAAWYTRIEPENYHVRWCCDRLELIEDGNLLGQYIARYRIGDEIPVVIEDDEYDLELCGTCARILRREAQYDP